MTERELFDALGKVSENYVQAALDSECPTRAQRIQKAAGTGFRYALVCFLLICCCYGAVKLHNIEKLISNENAVSESTADGFSAEDNPASHFSAVSDQQSDFIGNAVWEGDGGWYYAVRNSSSPMISVLFKDEKAGYKTELFTSDDPRMLLDMTYYEGSVYVLSTRFNQSYWNGEIETEAGILTVMRISKSEPTEVCETIKIDRPIEYGEMICHLGKIWFSAADSEAVYLYCYDLQTKVLQTIREDPVSDQQDLLAAMPHSICDSGKRIWFLMRNRDNGQILVYYDTEHSDMTAAIQNVDVYTVSGNTVWFSRGSDIFRADITEHYAVTETKLDHPYDKAPAMLLSDGESVFVCVLNAENGRTALCNLKTKEQYLLPKRQNQKAESVAVLSGSRIYAICDTHVYMAQWDGTTLGKWQIAYSTYTLDSPEVPE